MGYITVIRAVFLLLPLVSALKFDLQAHTGHGSKYERCIRNFVAKDTLVLVTAIVGGSKGDGQMVNMHVSTGPSSEGRQADAGVRSATL